MASTPEMVDLVNVLILFDRRVTVEDISEQPGISLGTRNKILYDDLFSVRLVVEFHQAQTRPQQNSRNLQSVWLGTVTILFTIQIWSNFYLFGFFKEFLCCEKSFLAMMM